MPGGVQGIAQRLKEPSWAHNPIDDREVAGVGVVCCGLSDDLHDDCVLLVRLRPPRLDVASLDEVEELIGFDMDSTMPLGCKKPSYGGLAGAWSPGEDQHRVLIGGAHATRNTIVACACRWAHAEPVGCAQRLSSSGRASQTVVYGSNRSSIEPRFVRVSRERYVFWHRARRPQLGRPRVRPAAAPVRVAPHGGAVPRVSFFDGIVITMYFYDHQPPPLPCAIR